MDRKPVELVRVPREEKYYDRDTVLGRDISSVFPTEAAKAAGGGGGLDPELVRAVLGGDRKFVSETELEEIKAKRGLSVEDGTIAADKPLAQILKEAKEAKEAAFQEQWKQMKTGKNRPLDEDELEFLDGMAEAEAARRQAAQEEEEEELAAFHAQQQGAGDEEGAGPLPAAAMGPQLPGEEEGAAAAAAARRQQQQQQQRRPPPVRPVIKPIVKIKQQQQQQQQQRQRQEEEEQPAGKRQHLAAAAEGGAEGGEGQGLAGLLGGYGSASDSD